MDEQALATSEPALDPKKRGRPRAAPEPAPEPDEPMFPVKLLRHYRPGGHYEIMGYHKASVEVKDAAGRWYELEPETFVEGEMAPPISHGVGYDTKIWADTYIKVPRSEARTMIEKKIAVRADDV